MINPSLTLGAGVGFGARAVAMGGAYTAVADDGTAPYWNPAGITQLNIITLTPGVGAQGTNIDQITDLFNNAEDGIPLSDLSSFENANLNLFIYLGMASKYVALNGFSNDGAIIRKNANIITAKAEGYSFTTLTLAGNLGQKLAAGVNFKKVYAKIAESYNNSTPTIPDDNRISYADGEGISYDLGFLFRASDQVKFGFVVSGSSR